MSYQIISTAEDIPIPEGYQLANFEDVDDDRDEVTGILEEGMTYKLEDAVVELISNKRGVLKAKPKQMGKEELDQLELEFQIITELTTEQMEKIENEKKMAAETEEKIKVAADEVEEIVHLNQQLIEAQDKNAKLETQMELIKRDINQNLDGGGLVQKLKNQIKKLTEEKNASEDEHHAKLQTVSEKHNLEMRRTHREHRAEFNANARGGNPRKDKKIEQLTQQVQTKTKLIEQLNTLREANRQTIGSLEDNIQKLHLELEKERAKHTEVRRQNRRLTTTQIHVEFNRPIERLLSVVENRRSRNPSMSVVRMESVNQDVGKFLDHYGKGNNWRTVNKTEGRHDLTLYRLAFGSGDSEVTIDARFSVLDPIFKFLCEGLGMENKSYGFLGNMFYGGETGREAYFAGICSDMLSYLQKYNNDDLYRFLHTFLFHLFDSYSTIEKICGRLTPLSQVVGNTSNSHSEKRKSINRVNSEFRDYSRARDYEDRRSADNTRKKFKSSAKSQDLSREVENLRSGSFYQGYNADPYFEQKSPVQKRDPRDTLYNKQPDHYASVEPQRRSGSNYSGTTTPQQQLRRNTFHTKEPFQEARKNNFQDVGGYAHGGARNNFEAQATSFQQVTRILEDENSFRESSHPYPPPINMDRTPRQFEHNNIYVNQDVAQLSTHIGSPTVTTPQPSYSNPRQLYDEQQVRQQHTPTRREPSTNQLPSFAGSGLNHSSRYGGDPSLNSLTSQRSNLENEYIPPSQSMIGTTNQIINRHPSSKQIIQQPRTSLFYEQQQHVPQQQNRQLNTYVAVTDGSDFRDGVMETYSAESHSDME